MSLIKLASLVEVSAKKGYKELNLQNKLVDQVEWLPDSIGKLSGLVTLDLSENRLVRLEELDLSSNRLSSLPNTIGSLVSLKKLNVETNDIDEVPHTIGLCSSLEELRVDYNQVRALPKDVGKIESLQVLFVRALHTDQNPLEVPPRNIAKQGAQAVVTYMADLVANKDVKVQPTK
ncbi:Plant intracellular Ras-group-related LRR protein 5 [Bienertia sinuspersici]